MCGFRRYRKECHQSKLFVLLSRETSSPKMLNESVKENVHHALPALQFICLMLNLVSKSYNSSWCWTQVQT